MMLFTRTTIEWQRRTRQLALFFMMLFLSEILLPTAAFALTGGPAQPEFQSFQQVGEDQVVDLFTGDFKYDIPLFELGGYPVNLNYAAGINMEQEASWVGLGWNLTPGMISRNVRGMADDIDGETVSEQYHMKKEIDIMVDAGLILELIGKEVDTEGGGDDSGESQDAEVNEEDSTGALGKLKEKLKPSFGLTFNFNSNRGFSIGGSGALDLEDIAGGSATAGLNYTPAGGLNLVPTIGLGPAYADPDAAEKGIGASVTFSYNTRNGLQNISFGLGHISKAIPVAKWISPFLQNLVVPINEYSYYPYSKPLMLYQSSAFNTKIGGDIVAFDGDITAKGSYAETKIAAENVTHKAYGYLYLQNATENDLTDFNRDGDASAYYPGQQHLTPASMMPDLYIVSGHGMAGTLRPYRMETGTVSEAAFENVSSYGADLGLEIASGNTAKGGWDTKTFDQYQKGHPWYNATGAYAGYESQPKNTVEQNIVFRHANEVTPVMDDYLSEIGDEAPIAYTLSGVKNAVGAPYPQRLQYDTSDVYQRLARQQDVVWLTADQAQHAALDKQLKNYTQEGDLTAQIPMGRASGSRKAHQLSEITCLDRTGTRYVYGIPAMNTSQKEVMFNVAGHTVTGDKVEYQPDDASTANDNGDDHYFYSKEMPAYAHSYLLTAWLGSDYIDMTDNGVTDDDYGHAVRFNWQKVHDNFGWRSPYDAGKALHSRQSLLSDQDDRGSYTYGTKEVWYPHSIESKEQIAFFYTKGRQDAFGVADEHGATANNDSLRLLDKIVIFSKKAYAAQGSTAEPLKVIEFEYDYSLCPNTPNSQAAGGGKLTLKKLYISHGNSTKGRLSPYVFSYDYNPGYAPTKTDRWGNYKGENTKGLAFDTYPYGNEEVPRDTLDRWAAAWNLNAIELPSGMTYSVTYEADDYAFVQDKHAQQMYHVLGIGSGTAFSSSKSLYKNNIESSLEREYLYLENPSSELDTEEELDGLIAGLKDDLMYFKFRVVLPGKDGQIGNGGFTSDFVRGYAEVVDIGFCNGVTDKIWVKINPVSLDGKGNDINAILKASLDYLYTGHQDLIFGGIHPNDNQVVKFIKNMITIKDDLMSLILGPYELMVQKGMAKSFEKDHSLVRLNHPTQRKVGGGHRVKRVEISDEWAALTGSNAASESTTTYGQEYFYNLKDGATSGVAQYEPSKGNDENPFKYPSYYTIGSSKSKKPKPSVFQEGPFGESFFPPATVGYARVTVRNIHAKRAKTAGTYSIHEFHTAKDFPFTVRHGLIQNENDTEKPVWAFFGYGKTKRYASTAQGHVFIFNDMHGKKKMETHEVDQVGFSGEKHTLRSTEYVYHLEGDELDNEVACIDRNGSYTAHRMGIDAEVCVDSWETYDEATNQTLQPNTSGFNIVIPGLIPPIWYTNSGTLKEYRTIVTTKIIQKQGILKKVIENNRNFTTTLTNEVWDSHTGEVLLTSRSTEYDNDEGRRDVQYSWSYPAYWSPDADRMGHAYRNTGYIGDVGAPFPFLTQAQYVARSESQKQELKSMIYRGLLDGLEDGIYQELSGNRVQGGVFAEGDEVYVAADQEVYHAEEVLTKADIDFILNMTGGSAPTPPMSSGGGSSIGPAGPSGQDTTNNQNDTSGIYEPCGSVVIISPTMWAAYQNLLNLSNTHTLNQANLPLLDNDPQLMYNYLNSPHFTEWYGMWHDPNFENLYHLMAEMMDSTDLRNLLATIYNDNNERQAYYNLFQCPEILACLMGNANNTTLINAFQALFAVPQRINLAAAIAAHYQHHYVTVRLGLQEGHSFLSGTSPGCYDNIENIAGLLHKVTNYPIGSTCPSIADFGSYEYFLDGNSYAYMQNLPDTSTSMVCDGFPSNMLGHDPDTTGVLKQPGCNNVSYTLFSFTQQCGTYAEPAGAAGGGVVPDSNQTDTLDQYYNLPLYDELVLFMDSDGNIIDLDGKEVQIIRSGRRNLLSPHVAEIASLNYNPIDNTAFYLNASVEGIINASAMTFSDDWPSDFMPEHETDNRFNPFRYGQRGIFRPKATYAAHDFRNYAPANARNNGLLHGYEPFWSVWSDSNGSRYDRVTFNPSQEAQDYWILAENMLYYSGTGAQLASVNALDIYSAMVVGRNNRVTGESVNSAHKNLLSEGFEPSPITYGLDGANQLLNAYEAFKKDYGAGSYSPLSNVDAALTADGSHTGDHALMLRGSETIVGVGDDLNTHPEYVKWLIPLDQTSNTFDNPLYRIPGFMPERNLELTISAWMQSVNTLRENPAYQGAAFNPLANIGTLTIEYYNGTTLVGSASVIPTGTSIDGWRRLYKRFTIPPNATHMALVARGGDFGTLLDDLRIFPTEASMAAYAFSNVDDRLSAILDDNNYATFYRYDQNGKLLKLERETATGRLTFKENLNNTAKRN